MVFNAQNTKLNLVECIATIYLLDLLDRKLIRSVYIRGLYTKVDFKTKPLFTKHLFSLFFTNSVFPNNENIPLNNEWPGRKHQYPRVAHIHIDKHIGRLLPRYIVVGNTVRDFHMLVCIHQWDSTQCSTHLVGKILYIDVTVQLLLELNIFEKYIYGQSWMQQPWWQRKISKSTSFYKLPTVLLTIKCSETDSRVLVTVCTSLYIAKLTIDLIFESKAKYSAVADRKRSTVKITTSQTTSYPQRSTMLLH